MAEKTERVLAVAPMPPEKCAYALARYSRSPDSIRQSVEWVRTHDSTKFLESFYFQYGHASIADLGHVVLCFEGVSELAVTEIEDEQLWDGQARSSRYQDFSRSGFITPPDLSGDHAVLFAEQASRLLASYNIIHERMTEHLAEKLPRPESMKPEVYGRNIAARAFDVARYLLFFGIPTGVGQVTSIRTLEKQIRRLKASEYRELREIGAEMAAACASAPACAWSGADEPLAPTLARHVDPDEHAIASRRDLAQWACQNLPAAPAWDGETISVIRPTETAADIAATLLYPHVEWPFAALYETVRGWGAAQRQEVIDVALGSRARRDELIRGFRGGLYAFDIVMDIGAYRDLHRHRRCHQFRQAYSSKLGFETPAAIVESSSEAEYTAAIQEAFAAVERLPLPASHYLLPFAARSRFLFKMDFAEAAYIAGLRSGVKGHFSYRRVAWEMKQKLEALEPELGRLIEATPPWVEDPLKR